MGTAAVLRYQDCDKETVLQGMLTETKLVHFSAMNASLGGFSPIYPEVLAEATSRANDADILFVAAAGNDSSDVNVTPVYPARFALNLPNTITVASTTNLDELSDFSNYGLTTVQVAALAPVYDAWSFKVLPRLGQIVAQDAESYRYLAESIRMHPDQETLASMMSSAGFAQVRVQNLAGGIAAIHSGWRL